MGRIWIKVIVAILLTTTLKAATTVTGTLLTPAEAAVTSNAYIRLELANYGTNLPRVLGTNTVLPSYIDIYPDSFGEVSTVLTGNELIDPGNTWYSATYYKGGTRFYRCDFYVPSLLTGTVDTNGTAVTLTAGTSFPYYTDIRGRHYSFDWVGSAIIINAVQYTIASVNSATSITLSTSAGIQVGVAYSHGTNTLNLDNVVCLNAVPPSAIGFNTCPICPAGATGAVGPAGPQGPAGTANMDVTIDRWAALVYSCGTGGGPIDRADGVFDEWDDSAVSTRYCPGSGLAASYDFPLASFTTLAAASSYHVISTFGNNWGLSSSPTFSIRTSFADRNVGFRRWIAWTSATILNMVPMNNPKTSQVMGFYACSDAGVTCEGGAAPDTGANNVYCYVADGTNSTYQDSGFDFTPNQVDLYQVFYDSPTSTATFKINGATVCTMAANAPLNTASVAFHSSITNVSGGMTYSMLVYAAFLKNSVSF